MRTLLLVLLTLGVAWWLGPTSEQRARHLADAAALSGDLSHEHPELTAPPAHGEGRLVVDLVDGADEAVLAQVEALAGIDLDWLDERTRDEALAVADGVSLEAAVAALRAHPSVEVVEPSVDVAALGWPDDPRYAEQWHLRAMGAEAGWSNTPRGAGVLVAVVDSGVALVPDLDASRVAEGASFVPGEPSWIDQNGHGTHVAGTIAQTTNNGFGTAGVAPDAAILPVKVLSRHGFGSSEQVAAGIDWAVDHGAQVINLSLGGPTPSRVIANAVQKARKRGVIVVAAVGNDGRKGVSWPGALREVIGVAAVGPDGTPAPYSNRGRGVDLAAPGGDKRANEAGGVLQDTLDPDGGEHAFRWFQGTSMAAPHVSGAAAALLSTGYLDADAVERLLLAGADGSRWTSELGWGRLDLEGSLAAIGGVEQHGPRLLGALLAFFLAGASGAGASWRLSAAVVGAAAAGGLPFLGEVPGPMGAWLGRGVLWWPTLAFGPTLGALAPWLAALVVLVVTFAAGPSRWARPAALGLAAGVAAHLAHAMVEGNLAPWWFPSEFATFWFGAQVLLTVFAALALAGVERLDRRGVRTP